MQGRGRGRQAGHLLASVTTHAPAVVSPHEAAPATRYMDAGQVAALVGVNRETVLRAWRSGALAGYATNRKLVRFTLEDIEEWMGSGRKARRTEEVRYSLRPTGRGRARRRAA